MARLFTTVLVAVLAAVTMTPGAPVGTWVADRRDAAAGSRRMTPVLLLETNRERRTHGLSALTPSEDLDGAARAHAEDMLLRNYFAHVSPEGQSLPDRMQKFSPRAIVLALKENIFESEGEEYESVQKRGEDVIQAWMESPGHRQNLLSEDSSHVGFGVASVMRQGRLIEYTVQCLGRVVGWWERSPESTIPVPRSWRAKLLMPLEFFLEDTRHPQRRYPDPSRASTFWKGGVPLLVSGGKGLAIVEFPRVQSGSYKILARGSGETGYHELRTIKVLGAPPPGGL